MLPFDYARCKPVRPDAQCESCARWAEHPQQIWGARTPVVAVYNSRDKHCDFIVADPESGQPDA